MPLFGVDVPSWVGSQRVTHPKNGDTVAFARQSLVLLLAVFSGSRVPVPGSGGRAPSGSDRIAFVHAAVIPMDEERVLRDYTVVVARGTIVEMGPSSAVEVPVDALRIDAKGRYLIPALCDMHVHPVGGPWNSWLRPDAHDSLPY